MAMLGAIRTEECPVKKSIALLFTLLLPCVALASGGGEEENAAPKVAYYSLVPALVGNFGAGPKLKFYKADIALRVTGRFHDIGAFTADIAALSRIVTLNNLSIAPRQDGALVLDTTAKTFRYLDPEEIAAQRKAAGAGAKK